jgi:hypothetical protein
MVYARPLSDPASETSSTTLPVPVAATVRECSLAEVTVTLTVRCCDRSPGLDDSEAVTATDFCEIGTVRVPCGENGHAGDLHEVGVHTLDEERAVAEGR